MYDLIGFWTAVTLAVLPVVVFVTFVLLAILDFMLYKASDKRFDLEKKLELTKRINDSAGDGCFFFLVAIAGLILGLIYFVGACIGKDYIQGIADFSVAAAPFVGWLGILVTGYTIMYKGSRMVFNTYYAVQDKLHEVETGIPAGTRKTTAEVGDEIEVTDRTHQLHGIMCKVILTDGEKLHVKSIRSRNTFTIYRAATTVTKKAY